MGPRSSLCGDSGLQPAAAFRPSLTCRLVTYMSATQEAPSGFLQLQARAYLPFNLGFQPKPVRIRTSPTAFILKVTLKVVLLPSAHFTGENTEAQSWGS